MTGNAFELLFLSLVGAGASAVGAVCGLGGGIIIKPILDSLRLFPVDTATFLSGCTVLAMSVASVAQSFRKGSVRLDLPAATALAVGAVAGGAGGQALFQFLLRRLPHPQYVGAAQSAALLLTTLAAFLYTLREERVRKRRLVHVSARLLCGFLLGVVAAFVGIGGGPVNILVLSYFFSMETKAAAANSLYIVMFSQAASLSHLVLGDALPAFLPLQAIAMAGGGVLGAIIGAAVSRRISSSAVRGLFLALMVAIICLSCRNLYAFLS